MSVVHVRELAPTVRLALGLQPIPARVWPGEAMAREGEGSLRPVLALDLGTRTGWALRWDEGHVGSGVEDLSGARRRESLGLRVLRFRRWLREVLSLSRPSLVVYERPVIHTAWHHRSVAHNMEGVLLAEIEGRRDYVSPPPSLVKRHATGRGSPTRAQVLEAARARWGRTVSDLDEADALCLLAWALDQGAAGGGP